MNRRSFNSPAHWARKSLAKPWIQRAPWVIRVGDAASQLLNTLVFAGAPNESLSGRCYRRVVVEKSTNSGWRFLLWFVDSGFFWQDSHCERAYRSDRLKALLLLNPRGIGDPHVGLTVDTL